MYNHHFGLAEAPFSIAPDPRYLYLSEQHREALAHLLYGIGDHGGFVVLTGEVGTGKTTVCRCLLQQIPEHIDIAVIVNPKLNSQELLQSICDELGVVLPEEQPSAKQMIDALNAFLLATHARGRNAILIIDEAQNLAVDVLEQLRLLTNLETNERKLLQLILLGQPELNTLLAQPSLRQLAQRITARYHLRPLSREEVVQYIEHRLAIAGCRGHLFTPSALARIYRYSKGIPRLVNLLCDRALLGVYAENGAVVDAKMVRRAAIEVLPPTKSVLDFFSNSTPAKSIFALALVAVIAGSVFFYRQRHALPPNAATPIIAQQDWRAQLQNSAIDESSALRDLFQLWGQSLPPESAPTCDQSVQSTLSCVHVSSVTIAELLSYNTPVVLRLQTNAAQSHFVVLKSLTTGARGDSAKIVLGQREWQLNWSELAALWHGEVLLLAPVPLDALPAKLGATGNLIAWFDEQLYRHFHRNERRWQREVHDRSDALRDGVGKQAWLVSHYLALREQPASANYDAALQEQVKQFQREQGLADDGVIDLKTVLTMSRLAAPEQPLLLESVAQRGG